MASSIWNISRFAQRLWEVYKKGYALRSLDDIGWVRFSVLRPSPWETLCACNFGVNIDFGASSRFAHSRRQGFILIFRSSHRVVGKYYLGHFALRWGMLDHLQSNLFLSGRVAG